MNEDAIIPHALGIEKYVLSVFFRYPDESDRCPWITSDHFHIPAHKIIFEKLKQSFKSGGEVELSSFVQSLISTGMLEIVGGAAGIYDVYNYACTPEAFSHHVAILSDFRAYREAIKAAERLSGAAMNHDADELREAVKTSTASILDAFTDGLPCKPLAEIARESIERFEARVKSKESAIGIPSIGELDAHLRGFHPGRMWVIGAYPEGGKSVMASQMVIDAATNGVPALFLTLEMQERDLMDRMIVQCARMDAKAFMEPIAYAKERDAGASTINKELMMHVNRSVAKIADSPLRLERPANRKLSTVIASIRKAEREMGIKVAAVDYLQLIRGGEFSTKEGEISEISHAMQEIAQDLGIQILILSQLNADGDTKHGRVIEEDADAVINIVQDRNKDSETYKQHRYVLIGKDRHYGSGGTRVPLVLDRERIRFIYGEDQTQQTKPKPQFNR